METKNVSVNGYVIESNSCLSMQSKIYSKSFDTWMQSPFRDEEGISINQIKVMKLFNQSEGFEVNKDEYGQTYLKFETPEYKVVVLIPTKKRGDEE